MDGVDEMDQLDGMDEKLDGMDRLDDFQKDRYPTILNRWLCPAESVLRKEE
jgi:hypothetical protein